MKSDFDKLLPRFMQGQVNINENSFPATFSSPGVVRQTVYNVMDYGAVGNGSTNDTTAIQNAIADALANGGGIVTFPAETFSVSSSSRTDTGVSYSDGTWTDASITAGDVGSYVLGANINNAKVPQITAVTPGVSFTTDIAPSGSVSSQAIVIVNPAFVLPAGVQLKGAGSSFAQSNNSQTTASTKILDKGSGITCLIRGGSGTSTQAIRYGMEDISIQGNSNSTMYGLYIGNFAWFFTARNCDFSHHGVAGVGVDGNINSDSFYDCTFIANGNYSSSTYTGGVIAHPYYLTASASLNFYNCFFNVNYGWGICDAKSEGASAVNLYNCQFNGTQATSATGSGTGMAIADHANGADAKAVVVGGWVESSALYDVDAYGSPTIIGLTCASNSSVPHMRVTSGVATLIGCRFENYSGASITLSSAGIVWMGCTCNDSYFYSGCGFSNGNIPAIGMSNNSGALQLAVGNCIRMGAGAPPSGTGLQGDFYFRTDGSNGSSLYLKTGSSTWTAMA